MSTSYKKFMGNIYRYLYADELLERIGNNPIVLIGAGEVSQSIIDEYRWNIKYAVDNDADKVGCTLMGKCMSVQIYGWDFLQNHYEDGDVLLITVIQYDSLVEQIRQDALLCRVDIHIYSYIWAVKWDINRIKASQVPFSITRSENEVIPRVIHYCWFSNEEFPETVKKCIDSWHRFCPNYEFRKWSLANYSTDNMYCNEALSLKKWSLASDYARCDVLYKYGGIYLDTDVELVKPLDDLLFDEGFFCFESSRGVDPGSGMGAVPHNAIMGEIKASYDNKHFICADGTYRRIHILHQYTSILVEHGLKRNGCYQKVDGVAVYPPLVLSPYSYRTGITSCYEKTYGIHHWIAAWVSEEEKRQIDFRKQYISSRIRTLL